MQSEGHLTVLVRVVSYVLQTGGHCVGASVCVSAVLVLVPVSVPE